MTKTKVYPIRLFFTSLGAGILLLLGICLYLEDFSSQKIFEYLFWVGGLLLVAGGSIFFPYNPYQGQTLAITTQLRHNSKGQGLERSDRDTTERFVRGMSIAAPGIIMVGVSYFFQRDVITNRLNTFRPYGPPSDAKTLFGLPPFSKSLNGGFTP